MQNIKESELSAVPTISDDMMTTYRHDIPECWSETQCNNFKMINKWLLVKNGKLGCKACMNVQNWQNFENNADKGFRPPTISWRTCQVSCGGRTLETKQSSLRKKIFEHRNSKGHIQAVQLEENIVQIYIIEHLTKFKSQTDVNMLEEIFQLVYLIIKEKRNFEQFRNDPRIQSFKSTILNSEKLFAFIIQHIAAELRKTLLTEIQAHHNKITIIVHESAINKPNTLAVHIKINPEEDDERALFFDLISLPSFNSDEIIISILNCLQKNYITRDYLNEHFLGFTFDQESKLLGHDSKIGDILLQLFPSMVLRYSDLNRTLAISTSNLCNQMKKLNSRELFETSCMADIMFVYKLSSSIELFDASFFVQSWLGNEQPKWSENLLENIKKKISNDMALAAETHDEERLVIDLQPEPNSQEIDNEHYAANINEPDNGGSIKRKKRSWRQTDKQSDFDRDAIERLIQQVREVSDSYAINEDKDKMFLLSLLPFMKQLNTRENLEFRMEVQQLIQKKLHANGQTN